jgi:hypothetical protein
MTPENKEITLKEKLVQLIEAYGDARSTNNIILIQGCVGSLSQVLNEVFPEVTDKKSNTKKV